MRRDRPGGRRGPSLRSAHPACGRPPSGPASRTTSWPPSPHPSARPHRSCAGCCPRPPRSASCARQPSNVPRSPPDARSPAPPNWRAGLLASLAGTVGVHNRLRLPATAVGRWGAACRKRSAELHPGSRDGYWLGGGAVAGRPVFDVPGACHPVMARCRMRQCAPGVLVAVALVVAVTVALKVGSRRKRTAALAAQWQVFALAAARRGSSSGWGRAARARRLSEQKRSSTAVVACGPP